MLVKGPNLTSCEFHTKWRGSLFCLTAGFALELNHGAVPQNVARHCRRPDLVERWRAAGMTAAEDIDAELK